MIEPALDGFLKIIIGVSFRGESPARGFLSGKSSSGKDQIGGTFFADQRRKGRACDRRIAAESDFWEAPFGVGRGEAHVAHHGEFGAAPQTSPLDFGNRDL